MPDQEVMVADNACNKTQRLFSQAFDLDLKSMVLTETSASSSEQGSGDQESKVTRDTLPHAIVRLVEWTPLPVRGQATWGVWRGMLELACSFPTYIDAFLIVYLEAIALSPNKTPNSMNSNLAFQLLMNMTETATTGYRTNDSFKPFGGAVQPGRNEEDFEGRPGRDDTANASNIVFQEKEVQEHLDQVMKSVLIQVHEGNDFIVRAAMYARLGVILKAEEFQWFKGMKVSDYGIEVSLKKQSGSKNWIKDDLIATLIGLRGYAKSLSETFAETKESKLEEWKGLLKRWIYDPELDTTRDLMVKHHVILALKNLQDGPFDETSSELFRPRDWVF